MDYVYYLDYAASAPMRQEALDGRETYEASPIGLVNPNFCTRLVVKRRESLMVLVLSHAQWARLGSRRCLCSGGTEGNNLCH